MLSDTFTIPARAPFRLDLTVWALRRRRTNLVDRWDGHQYQRVFVINGRPVKTSVVSKDGMGAPGLVVSWQAEGGTPNQLKNDLRLKLQKMLGLDLDLEPFYRLADQDETLRALAYQYRGVKPPRFPDLFEALINAIACQQVTLDLGILMINRLAENFGMEFKDGGSVQRAFPGPEELANAPQVDLKRLGFSSQKVRAIKELAAVVADQKMDLVDPETMDNLGATRFLSSLHGIGRWSAEYVLLRGLGRLDIFPGDDVGAQNNLQHLFQMDHKPGYADIQALSSAWHPYQGLVYFHLLLDKLHARGLL